MGVSSNAQSKAKQNLIKVLHKCGLLESVRKGRKKKEWSPIVSKWVWIVGTEQRVPFNLFSIHLKDCQGMSWFIVTDLLASLCETSPERYMGEFYPICNLLDLKHKKLVQIWMKF